MYRLKYVLNPFSRDLKIRHYNYLNYKQTTNIRNLNVNNGTAISVASAFWPERTKNENVLTTRHHCPLFKVSDNISLRLIIH